MSLKKEILSLAESHFADIVKIRRDLHAHPEVGFEVQRTAGIVAAEMNKLGLKVKEGVGKTGVTADLIVSPTFPMIALRADMDALPMHEEGNPSYKSQVDGAAHMCGHDAHTAMLIGAARIITALKGNLKVNVRFLFQPNEENLPGGAPAMIQDGALEGVREITGIHVWPIIETGRVGSLAGILTAQPDRFEIEIKGRGGHAALPSMCIDPIVIGAQIVNSLQTIISRNVDALENAILSVTQFHAGTTHNVIPETAYIQGTVRTMKASVQKNMRARVEKIAKGICEAHGAECKLSYVEGYPSVINNPQMHERVLKSVEEILSKDKLAIAEPIMGGEDFAYYAQKVPGCFYFLGIRNEAKGITKMCHDPRFDIDEDALTIGMAMHSSVALSSV
jgi:amidohydrolase